ncbi:hypothetical protein [Vibrio navarrensis]|uniref:hypothetical protein n=1 Tax=Vibrio navarrensis TaxID=29495 RepID=UPI001559CFDF|nr:hypothetical protein [Vibrio navarrensis]
MKKILSALKSRKVISAIVTLLSAMALSYGYSVSPTIQSALSVMACELIECTE